MYTMMWRWMNHNSIIADSCCGTWQLQTKTFLKFRHTLSVFVNGLFGSNLFPVNLYCFYIACLMFIWCLLSCLPRLCLRLFVLWYAVVYGVMLSAIFLRRRSTVVCVLFLAFLEWSAVVCGFQAYRYLGLCGQYARKTAWHRIRCD